MAISSTYPYTQHTYSILITWNSGSLGQMHSDKEPSSHEIEFLILLFAIISVVKHYDRKVIPLVCRFFSVILVSMVTSEKFCF